MEPSSEPLKETEVRIVQNKLVRWLFIGCGNICVVLAFLGIFLPLLPTTPFLLLAAFLYARSSATFYHWLLTNKWFGPYIRSYRNGEGIPRRAKILALFLLWSAIGSSCYFFVDFVPARILLVLIAVGISVHLCSLPTREKVFSFKESECD